MMDTVALKSSYAIKFYFTNPRAVRNVSLLDMVLGLYCALTFPGLRVELGLVLCSPADQIFNLQREK